MVIHCFIVFFPRVRSMIKNLVKHGNSWSLVVDKSILELWKIDPEQPLELSTDGHTMTIAPAGPDLYKQKVRAARKKVFKKLAEELRVVNSSPPRTYWIRATNRLNLPRGDAELSREEVSQVCWQIPFSADLFICA